MSWHSRIFVVAFLFSVAGLLALGIATGLARHRKVASQTSRLIHFDAKAADGTNVKITPFAGQPTVLIYFEPDCDHCQQEATEYQRAASSIGPVRVLWLSSAPQPALRRFAGRYDLALSHVLYLDREFAYRHFGFAAVPDIMVYRANGHLSHRFKGQTNFKEIQAYL